MRKIINIAVVLGAVFCLVGVALARTVWLPEYEEKFEGMDSCAAHGMLSAVEKDEKNLTCLNSQFIQWVGICYKNCKCKFEWTKEKCESKIDGVWRVSGRSCDDGTYVYWEDCVNGACDNRVDNLINSEWGCKEYWEDCPSKCKIPYPDNCHNREDARTDENDVCVKFWEDCEEKCEDKITCKPNNCNDYPLKQRPNNAASVGECMIECGDYTPRYRIEACKEGYEMNADKTECVCKDNECAEKCFIRESKDDDRVAEWEVDSCSAGCGDNTVSYYKINKCKDLFTAKTDGKDCITDCMCESTESCDGYPFEGGSEGPDKGDEHAMEYSGGCTPDCGETWKYKAIACVEGFVPNKDTGYCDCDIEFCKRKGFIFSGTYKDANNYKAEFTECAKSCEEEPVYKIDYCKEPFIAKTDDASGNITACECPENATQENGACVCPDNATLDGDKCVCNEGYEWNEDNTQCVESCESVNCAEQCFIYSTNTGVDGAVWADKPCSVGCGEDGDTPLYKITGCEELLTAVTDENGCIESCKCESTESCKGYPFEGDSEGPSKGDDHAVEYIGGCTTNCGETWKYKVTKCEEGYVPNEETGYCNCDTEFCKNKGYTVAENERIANASYDSCTPSCGGDTMYKLNGCNETFIEKTDASGNITCECPENATLENGACVCPAYSELIDGKCVCVKYRHWDSEEKKCVCNEGSYETVNAKESNDCKCKSINRSGTVIATTWTEDGLYCMYGCSLDKYNDIGETACVIFTGYDGKNASLVGLTKEGKNTCYIDGEVKISPNNNMYDYIPQWNQKTFEPCEGKVKMQVSGTSTNTGWGRMTGKITFNVPFDSVSNSSLAFEDADVTFNEEAMLEELILDGANRIQIGAGKQLSINSLNLSSGNTAIYLDSGSILNLDNVDRVSGNLVIYDQNNKEIEEFTPYSSPCERSCIYGDSM